MANIRIKIESSKNNQVDAGQDSSFNDGTENQKQDAASTKMATMGVFANQMLGVGKAALSFATSNIGTFTGDSVLQDNVNTMLGIVGDASSLIMGAATGPVGLAVAAIGLATKYTFQAIDYNIQRDRADKQSNYLRERTGGSTTEGSRTGGF